MGKPSTFQPHPGGLGCSWFMTPGVALAPAAEGPSHSAHLTPPPPRSGDAVQTPAAAPAPPPAPAPAKLTPQSWTGADCACARGRPGFGRARRECVCECVCEHASASVFVRVCVCECASRAPGVHSKLSTDRAAKAPALLCCLFGWLGAGPSERERGPERGPRERAGPGGFCAPRMKEGAFERRGKTGQGRDVVGAKGWVCRADPSCV